MPVGTGAERLDFLPQAPFVRNPDLFNQRTRKNIHTPISVASPALGGFFQRQLPQDGIIGKILVRFSGTYDVETADATTGHDWPYGLLNRFKLSANGQNDLFSCSGVDLHVLRFARYPAYDEAVDDFDGTVGGGDTIAVATDYELDLTWEIPIAMDDVSLVGALFAQSSAVNLQVRLDVAAAADIFSGNPGNVTNFDGDWDIQLVTFDVPIDGEGNLVIPDLSRLHGFNAIDEAFTQTTEHRTPLIRSAGQLARLFVSVEDDTNSRLSALPSSADADTLDVVRLEYGGNQRPFIFDPASKLLAINGQHYGAPLPYDRLCLDFVKEHPIRDALIMQGVTELALVTDVDDNVTVTNGNIHVVQETLF